jgi:CTP:molybdopterin cytidylyltransferase MocA
MPLSGPALITFVGGMERGPAADLVAGAHDAIALDLFAAAQASGAFERLFLVTDRPSLAAAAPASVVVEAGAEPFHVGRRLAELVARHRLTRALYLSRGALPFITAGELAAIADQLRSADALVIANNLFSADLIGFTPASALERITLPAIDNPLARLLEQEAGLPAAVLERSATTLFDLDTPTDLLVMQVHGGGGERTRAYLASLQLDDSKVRRAIRPFTQLGKEVLVAGRVSSATWARLEATTLSRVRVFSEERGMKADGREGSARSLLGDYLEAVGPEGLFAALGRLADAAFIDSRVLFAHLGLPLSTEDRFQSDLGHWNRVGHPLAAQITRAACEAPFPVVLGGHSLVAGGLWALVDAAWSLSGPGRS